MRIWARQAKQFADEITDAAVLDDLKAQGYQKVQWHSEEDARVCDICYERNNKIYDIDNIPPKPHINCRCWLTGIK
jgi:SPP1 gp7 family putative phage head morphogenesis protein